MTVPVITDLGEIGFDKGTGSPRTITTTKALLAGDLLVVMGGATDGINNFLRTDFSAASDSGSNTWTLAGGGNPGAYAIITTPLSIGATITVTYATPTIECSVVNAHAFRGFNYPTTATLDAYRSYLGLAGSGSLTRAPNSSHNSSATDTGIVQDPGAASGNLPTLTPAYFFQTHDFLTGAALGAPAGGVHMALLAGLYGSDNPAAGVDDTDLTTRVELAGYTSLEFTYGTIRRQLAAVLDLGVWALPVYRLDKPGFNTFIDLSVADGTTFNYAGALTTLQFWYYPDAAAESMGRLPLLGAG